MEPSSPDDSSPGIQECAALLPELAASPEETLIPLADTGGGVTVIRGTDNPDASSFRGWHGRRIAPGVHCSGEVSRGS